MSVHIVRAQVVIQLPVVCHDCGCRTSSERFRVAVDETSTEGLTETLRSQRVGTHFPVGWASYHGVPDNIYRCPSCVK